ncbi:MAG: glycosyltransferase family 39 protein [Solirubrobacteraceae bacterium]
MSATARAQANSPTRVRPRVDFSPWSGSAWGAIAITAAFIGITCWWLTRDRSIPIYDAGDHLGTAIYFHEQLAMGHLLEPFNNTSQYPPLAHLVGALAMFIGGVNVVTPIIAENLVFVSLLTLGCYQTGRLLFGLRAGLLAAIFVLGSPLLIAQLHVFMLDAPETALVAVSMWLLLASEDFSRVRIAAFAGLAVGCGLLVKVQFPFFLAGIVLVAIARGGWRHWRGLAVFAAVALVIGAPWYIDHFSELSTITKLAGTESGAVAGNQPPTLSFTNLLWYFWSTLNSQLFVLLFVLVLGGTIWTVVAVVRREESRWPRLEFLVGGLVAWLAITLTPHHDIRYDMPLMPYLAVIGTGWIVHLSRVTRLLATGVLVLAVVANTLATTFGIGKPVEAKLVSSPPNTEAFPDRIVLYSNAGFLVAGPRRDGDVPGLLTTLKKEGADVVVISLRQSKAPDFSVEGLLPLFMIAKMLPSLEPSLLSTGTAVVALVHQTISPGLPPTCTTLSDGTGVWVLRLDPRSGKVELYCPFHNPRYYS